MNPRTSHKLIAAGGMASAIAVGVAIFFLRSTPVAPAVSAAAPTAPVAEAPATVPPVAAEAPFAPAPVAEIPATPAVLPRNGPVSRKGPRGCDSARRRRQVPPSFTTGERRQRHEPHRRPERGTPDADPQARGRGPC